MHAARRALGAAGLLFGLGCATDDAIAPPPPLLPEILAFTVASNPDNVLSAVVTMRVRLADSVTVRYGPGLTVDSTAPAVIPVGDSAAVPILGLLPSTAYALRVVAYRDSQVVLGTPYGFTTDTLPGDLPRYVAGGADPSPGYVVFAAGRYGIVIDNTGRVVWYHRFPTTPGLNFQAQPTGRYVARPPTTDPSGPWYEIDPLGRVTRSFGCAHGLVARFHDLIAEPDGAYWIMCDDTRTMDLSGVGGVANAQVTGTVVQHVSGTGELLFEWSPFDHFQITDLDSAGRATASVNWTHGNALDLDAAGHLFVSFRSLSEITKIDTRTGAVVWRMGGLRNQFAFQNAPTPGFARQHGLRVTAPGRLVLLDNLGDPGGSRAERYTYDETSHTAQLVGSYGPNPAVTAQLGGTTQNLAGGRTLVAYGNGDRVEEYDASGAMIWHIAGATGYIFRAQRIASLYRPGVNSPR
jgi:arylsulfotransferase ASST